MLDHIFSGFDSIDYFFSEYIDDFLKRRNMPEKLMLIQLSAQMYERRPMYGSIIFLEKEQWDKVYNDSKDGHFLNLENISQELRRFEIDNLKYLRKLMEMNTEKNCMIAFESPNLYIAGIASEYLVDKLRNDISIYSEVVFKGYLKYDIITNDCVHISYDNGMFKLYTEDGQDAQWRGKVQGISLEAYRHDSIVKIIEKLKEEEHGTSIVFMDKKTAAKEIQRLKDKNRIIKLSKTEENKEDQDKKEIGSELIDYLNNLKGIIRIDGALLADLDGSIYAIGVIFDGDAVCIGDMSRGARYNSVRNYVTLINNKYKEEHIFGVVVSEDKNIDVVEPEILLDANDIYG